MELPRMHVSLYVSDIKATTDFYTTFFNQKASKIKQGYAKFELESPGLIISFVENAERVQSNFGHLGFQVESKEAMLAQLEIAKKQGIVSLEEMGTACCYAIQDKFWATDPDGVQWEIYYFHEDSEFNDPQYAMADASACCTSQTAGSTTQLKPNRRLSDLNKKEPSCEPGSGCC